LRTGVLIAVAAVTAVFLVAAAGVYAYDRGHDDVVAEGVTVGGIDVGGLTVMGARARLQDELLDPLREPVVVRARGKRFRLTAREAKTAADLDRSVAEAVRRSREGNLLSRTIRAIRGERLEADVEPEVTYSSEAVGRLVSRVKRAIDRAPRDATIRFAASGLDRTDGRTGLSVDKRVLRDRVEAALLEPVASRRRVKARVRTLRPDVTRAELAEKYATVLTVDRANFRLHLFKGLKPAKTYPIALGAAGQETPRGVYSIANKAVNPAWNVPDSDWAGDLAGKVIPPGPDNPIKARWLGVYDGVGIHGTADRGSIGSFASKGCIRMLVEDVTDLYDRVPVGAQIYIS
jgi:hypothetical protein